VLPSDWLHALIRGWPFGISGSLSVVAYVPISAVIMLASRLQDVCYLSGLRLIGKGAGNFETLKKMNGFPYKEHKCGVNYIDLKK